MKTTKELPSKLSTQTRPQGMFETIPLELSEKIASFLPRSDVLNLTVTSSFFANKLPHLRREALSPLVLISMGRSVGLCVRQNKVFVKTGGAVALGVVELPEGTVVRQVAVAKDCAAIIYKNGTVNILECRGYEYPNEYRLRKLYFPEIREAQQLVIGNRFSLLLSTNGEVYSVDMNDLDCDSINLYKLRVPSATQLAAGDNHFLILCKNGEVFRQRLCSLDLRQISLDKGVIAEQVAAGGNSNFIKCKGGAVLSFGDNGRGQLGLGRLIPEQAAPKAICLPEGVIARKVVAGANHTLIHCTNGEVYGFGSNASGQLGLEKGLMNQFTPSLIPSPLPKGMMLKEVVAGITNSFFIGESGKFYGLGQDCRLLQSINQCTSESKSPCQLI